MQTSLCVNPANKTTKTIQPAWNDPKSEQHFWKTGQYIFAGHNLKCLIAKPAPPTLVLLQHFQFDCFRMQGSLPLWWIGALQNGCLFNQKQHNVPPLKSQSTVKYHLVFSPCAAQVPRQPPGANTIPTARQQHSYQTHTAKAKEWPYHNKILDKKKN